MVTFNLAEAELINYTGDLLILINIHVEPTRHFGWADNKSNGAPVYPNNSSLILNSVFPSIYQ